MTREEALENVHIAFDTLRANKLRSGLTILGIVIGVTSVIAVASIIEGLNRFVQMKVDAFGPRTFFVARINAGPRFGAISEKLRKRKFINYEDAEYVRNSCPSIKTATAFATRAFFFGETNTISYENERVERILMRGVEAEYADALPQFAAALGRFISRYDEEHARPVVVLGNDIAQSLFPSSDPLGRTVRLNSKLYEVIGVMEKDSGAFGGPGIDQFAIIPLSDFRKNYPATKEIAIAFIVDKNASVEKGKDEVTEAMRRRRKVPTFAEDDFELISPDFISALWKQLTGALVILTAVISSIGLLVGGIGVMNIMLISVTERTAEIGIRKAVGARKGDIRLQFLFEAVVLTLIGGIIGITFGGLIAFAVRTLAPSVPAQLSLVWVVLGVLMSMGVGLFFGYYPANKAAQLDPIVCLRYE